MSAENSLFSQSSRFLLLARYFAYFLLTCLLVLGSTVIWGWYTHNALIVQISPNYVPMQFNTALSFIVIALGLFCIERNYQRLAQILGIFVTFIAMMVLLEYVFSFDTGLDQLFIQHYITIASARPGQMAPNTALAFMIAGISMLLLSVGKYTTKRIVLVIFLSFILFILGYTTFVGYYFGANTLSRWRSTTSMAWHTACGLMLWGAASIILGLVEAKERGYKPKVYLTTILFLTNALIFTFLWQVSIFHESRFFSKTVSNVASEINKGLSNKLTIEFFSLNRLASRHSLKGEDSYWEKDVKLYLEHHDSIYLIGKINQTKTILQPYVKSDISINLPTLQQSMHSISLNENAISLAPVELDNHQYFVAFFPLAGGGAVVVLYRADTLIRSVLSVAEKRYNLALRLNHHLLASVEGKNSPSLKKRWGNTTSFTLYKGYFQLTVWPSWQVLREYKSQTPNLIIISGIILSFCIALLFFQKQSFYQKALALEKFNDELENFSYTIAHNLKAPLRHITGYIHLFFRYQNENNEAGKKKCLSAITEAAGKMDKLIDSLLLYASFSRIKELKKCSFSLNKAIDEAISKLPHEQTSMVQWNIGGHLPMVFADYAMLTTLFKEVFENAIKFTKSSQKIEISVDAVENKRGVLIIIKDSGIGLNPQYQEKAFLLFHQLDKEDFKKGIGAGLAYIKKIVERHEGAISIESHVPQGTSIQIFLPALS